MKPAADHPTDTPPDTPFGRPHFVNPWSLRVFGVTLAAAEAGLFTLQEFQQALIAQIQAWESSGRCIDSDESYYTRWTEALTELLCRKNALPAARLPAAEQAVRDALQALRHEHTHDDEHDHDHDHEAERDHIARPQPVHVDAAR